MLTRCPRFDPNYVRSLRRFSDKGIIPPLSEEHAEAIEYFGRLCLQESIRNVLMVGDVHFMGNNHLFHSRTPYKDHPPPAPRRHLLRLWLPTQREKEAGSCLTMIAIGRRGEVFKLMTGQQKYYFTLTREDMLYPVLAVLMIPNALIVV